jgi:hypothetical protein
MTLGGVAVAQCSAVGREWAVCVGAPRFMEPTILSRTAFWNVVGSPVGDIMVSTDQKLHRKPQPKTILAMSIEHHAGNVGVGLRRVSAV